MNTPAKHNPIKAFAAKLLKALKHFNPLRGELVEVEVKMVGNHLVYTYTRLQEKY